MEGMIHLKIRFHKELIIVIEVLIGRKEKKNIKSTSIMVNSQNKDHKNGKKAIKRRDE